MFKISLLISFILCMFIFGCATHSDYADPHTHIWVGDWEKNIWTYKQIDYVTQKGGIVSKIKGHAEYQLKKGDRVNLKNGPIIKEINGTIYVDSQPIPDKVLNVYIDSEGKLEYHTFIPTFD